jgi:cytochrome c oxidase subunit 2
MNSLRRIILGFAILLAVAAAGLLGQETTPGPSGSAPIEVKAKKYEFEPAVIKVKQGDHVKLVVTATDRDHGIKIAGYNINQRLDKGVPTTVEFTADRAGTFPFECSVACGLGHHKMKGELVVEPASRGAAASGTTP